MCPAVILAANRNDRVIGRTIILVDSINTRNGFNQSGAPSGRKWAIDFLGACCHLDRINLSHIGSPRVNVKIRWLDKLNVYGNMPIKLVKIIIRNKEDVIVEKPFNDLEVVRISWDTMISRRSDRDLEVRLGCRWKDTIDPIINIILIRRNKVVVGINDLEHIGSKVEKISGIIKIQGTYWRLWRSLVYINLES